MKQRIFLKRRFASIFALLFFSTLLIQFPTKALDFEVKVSNFTGSGGFGSTDGDAKTAQFLWIRDVSVDSKGDILVLDRNGIRKIDSNNQVSTLWRVTDLGQAFCAIAVDKSDIVWLLDCSGNQVTRISPLGQTLNTFAILPSIGSSWVYPGIAFLPSGNMLVASYYQAKIVEVSPKGEVKDFLVGSNTSGCGTSPRLLGTICPISVAATDSGRVYFVNQNAQNLWEIAQVDSNKSISIASPANPQSSWSPFTIKFLNGFIWTTQLTQDSNSNDPCTRKNSLNMLTSGKLEPRLTVNTLMDWGLPFTLDKQGNLVTGGAEGKIRRTSSQGSEIVAIGQSNMGCQDGNRGSAKFISPNGIAQHKNGTIVVKDQISVRLIDLAGNVSTIYKAPYLPNGGGKLFGDEYYFLLENRLVSININNKNLTQKQIFVSGQDYFAGGSGRSFEIDSQGNLFVIIAKGNWSNRVLRKVSPTGQQSDLIGFGSGDAAIYLDSKDDLYIAHNNFVRKYDSRNLTTSSVVTNYSGYSTTLGLDQDSSFLIFTTTTSLPGGIKNTFWKTSIGGSTQYQLINSEPGSQNLGKESSFIQVSDMVKLESGDWLVADTGNHSLRILTINEIQTPVITNPMSATPSPINASPVPSQTVSSSSEPTVTKSPTFSISRRPATPSFSLVNFNNNKINIDINIGESESEKPDHVYLIAPKLGVSAGSPLEGNIKGSKASWSLDLGNLVSGNLIPLEVVSEKNGLRSEPVQATYQVPNTNIMEIKSPPVAPKNFSSKVVGTSIFVSVESTNNKNAQASGVHLYSKSLGVTKSKAYQGDVVGNKGLIEIPIKKSMVGKKYPVIVFFTNEAGESKPLNALLNVPSAGKISNIPTVIPAPKPPKTVICARQNQTRAFEGESCPPGWEKR